MGKIIVVCFFFFVGYIADNSKKLVHIFILKYSTSADPEGGTWGLDPPLENHKLYGFL